MVRRSNAFFQSKSKECVNDELHEKCCVQRNSYFRVSELYESITVCIDRNASSKTSIPQPYRSYQ